MRVKNSGTIFLLVGSVNKITAACRKFEQPKVMVWEEFAPRSKSDGGRGYARVH